MLEPHTAILPVIESQGDLIEYLFKKTSFKIAAFLKKMGYTYTNFYAFLRDPKGLHKNALISIAQSALNDILGAYYFHIKSERYNLKSLYTIIFNKLFRGK